MQLWALVPGSHMVQGSIYVDQPYVHLYTQNFGTSVPDIGTPLAGVNRFFSTAGLELTDGNNHRSLSSCRLTGW